MKTRMMTVAVLAALALAGKGHGTGYFGSGHDAGQQPAPAPTVL